MFGVVPKPLWEKRAPADERNRIRLGLRPLLVRGERTLLIDAGIGDKMGEKSADIYGIDRARDLDHALAEAGLAADDIDIVLATHLHFDHAGGFTRRDGSRQDRADLSARALRRPRGGVGGRDASARAESRQLSAGELRAARRRRRPRPDRRATARSCRGSACGRTGGHTMHHQIVLIESGGRTAVFAADLMPTTAHVDEPWIMGYDLYPMDTLAFKRTFVREAIERDVRDLLRARSGHRGRHHPRTRAAGSGRTTAGCDDRRLTTVELRASTEFTNT